MKTLIRILAIGATLALPLALTAKITRTVEKTFTVKPGGSLKATTEGGDITVQTADAGEVRIVAKEAIRASSEKEADELLTKLDLTFEQKGDDVTVESKYEKMSAGFHFGSWPPVQVSFVITVPKSYNLNLHTSGGDIGVASVTGNVRARTSGGDLKFARIDGELDAATSGGDVSLVEGTARAKLTTSGGDIRVERAGGPTEVSTSGGNINLDSVADLIGATTSGGNIHAAITGPIKHDTVLSTSGGQVKVKVVKDAGFELDASTSGGDVDASGLTLTIENGGIGKSHLKGSVNGGGPVLKLRSSGGDISIHAD